MTSLVMAFYYLTYAFGEMLDILLMTFLPTDIMEGQVLEFSIFAVIMLLDMVLLAFLARRYTYIEELNKQ